MNPVYYFRMYCIFFLVSIGVSLLILLPFYGHNIPQVYAQLPIAQRESVFSGSVYRYIPFSWGIGSILVDIIALQVVALPFYLFFVVHTLWLVITPGGAPLQARQKRFLTSVLLVTVFLYVLQVANWRLIGDWLVD